MKAQFTGMAIAAAACLAVTAAARADQSENDARQLQRAKISLGEAVAIAEAKAGGHASKAEFERGAEGWIFDVEIVADKTVSDVHVSAETGDVVSTAEDAVDSDDDEDVAD